MFSLFVLLTIILPGSSFAAANMQTNYQCKNVGGSTYELYCDGQKIERTISHTICMRNAKLRCKNAVGTSNCVHDSGSNFNLYCNGKFVRRVVPTINACLLKAKQLCP